MRQTIGYIFIYIVHDARNELHVCKSEYFILNKIMNR